MELINIYNMKEIIYWGLGIGDWRLGPIPNPQSPIPTLINKNYLHFSSYSLNLIKLIN